MKKLTALSVLLMIAAGLSAQSYRYLKLETLRCSNHKWQEIEWFADGIAHPDPKMTGNTSNGMTVSGDGGELYLPYDGDVETHKWIGYLEPPQSIAFTLDLGEGEAIDPDSMQFTKPSYSLVMDFRVWASNDDENWTLLLDITDLESDGHSTMTFPLAEFADTVAPSVPGDPGVLVRTSSSISLAWAPSTDNLFVAGYEIFVDGILNGTSALNSHVVTGLDEGTSYDIFIVAFDEAGNRSVSSDTITVETKITDTEAPSEPVNLVLDSARYDKLYFSWDASTDNDEVAGYLAYLNGTIAGISKDNRFSLPGLNADSLYTVAVSARDASGNVSASAAEAQFRTTDDKPARMPIGTNFWNLGWGGEVNDPFVSGHQSFVVSGDPWKQEFLDETRFYSHFRYMDYLETNNSELSHWLERTPRDHHDQNPMAFEWMIHLCNTQHTDLWFTVPHRVVSRDGLEGNDNHFMKKLAILVKTGIDMNAVDLDDEAFAELALLTEAELLALGGVKTCDPLDPDLKFYIEYSNETWNGLFSQFRYCVDEGTALNLEGDQYARGRRFHAWAAIRLFEDAEEVFGEGNPRLMRVDAYQAVSPNQIRDHYSVYKDAGLNPRGIYPDAFCPAPYFGNGEDGNADDIVDRLVTGNSGIISRTGSLRNARAILDAELENGYPVSRLIAYEAGQHVIVNAHALSRNGAIYDLYIRYLDSCNAYLDEMSHYLHNSTYSSGGAWGSKEYIGQDIGEAHKYRALYQWSNGNEKRPDSEAPTPPSNLTYSELTSEGYTLHWTPGTDNHKVVSYTVHVNDDTYPGIADTLLAITGLEEMTSYANTVQSVDSTGNTSVMSQELVVTTLEEPGGTVVIERRRVESGIYPNPCSGFFKLATSQQGVLEMFSVDGKRVKILQDYAGQPVYAGNLEAGTYVIKFNTSEATRVELLVKE